MMDLTKERTRVEFKDIHRAFQWRKKFGGRVVLDRGDTWKIWWYSYKYTATEIFRDLPVENAVNIT